MTRRFPRLRFPRLGLHPFFCYFGGKYRIGRYYPEPRHSMIIEPFAGEAGYSLWYPSLKIRLFDLNPIICGVWDYLIHVRSEEIMRLPIPVLHVDDHDLCQEAKWLIGYWLNKGSIAPRKIPSAWAKSGIRPDSQWGQAVRYRIASQVNLIRHWRVDCRSYEYTPDLRATWFIDPPYQNEGHGYPYQPGSYKKLSQWCQTRSGQIIVCESQGADWLPFRTFRSVKKQVSRSRLAPRLTIPSGTSSLSLSLINRVGPRTSRHISH